VGPVRQALLAAVPPGRAAPCGVGRALRAVLAPDHAFGRRWGLISGEHHPGRDTTPRPTYTGGFRRLTRRFDAASCTGPRRSAAPATT
jgi:hypothetical protein